MSTSLKVSTFRERFTELYSESEKTMKDLSKDLHVSNQTISAWCVGTRSPKEPTIIAIADHFDVNVKWLMGFDVPKYDIKLNLHMFDSTAPVTSEARIISGGIDKMPPDRREQALKILQVAFSEYADFFKEDNDK